MFMITAIPFLGGEAPKILNHFTDSETAAFDMAARLANNYPSCDIHITEMKSTFYNHRGTDNVGPARFVKHE